MAVLDAKLIDHQPYCPECNIILGNIVDCDMVEYKGNKYTQFIRRCDKCDSKVQYCETELGEKESRVVFPNKELKKIKDKSSDVNSEN